MLDPKRIYSNTVTIYGSGERKSFYGWLQYQGADRVEFYADNHTPSQFTQIEIIPENSSIADELRAAAEREITRQFATPTVTLVPIRKLD